MLQWYISESVFMQIYIVVIHPTHIIITCRHIHDFQEYE